jgi:hypothetical protein
MAVSLQHGAKKSLVDSRNEIAKSIANDRVRQMFVDVSAMDEVRELKTIDRHVSAQRRVANDAASQGRVELARNEATLAWNDPQTLRRSIAIIEAETKDMAARNGFGEDFVKAETANQVGVLYSSVIGAAALKSPAEARKLFNQHKDAMPAQIQVRTEAHIQSAENTARVRSEHAMAVAERQARKKAAEAFGSFIADRMSNPEGVPDWNALAMDPVFRTPAGTEYLARINSFMVRETKPETLARVSEANAPDLLRRMQLPVGDSKRIETLDQLAQEYTDRKIDRGTFDWLSKKLTDARTPDGERVAKIQHDFTSMFRSQFTDKQVGIPDPQGDPAFYAFTRYVDERVRAARKEGKDEYKLFDPTSPDYLGSKGTIDMFRASLQDRMRAMSERISAPTGERRLTDTPGAPKSPGVDFGLDLSKLKKQPAEYKNSDEVRDAFKSGRITEDQAKAILVQRGWAKSTQ